MISKMLGLVGKKELEPYLEKLDGIEQSISQYNKAVKKHNALAFSDDGKILEIEMLEESILNEIFQHIKDLSEGIKIVIDSDDKKSKVAMLEKMKNGRDTHTHRKLVQLEKRIQELEGH